MICPWSSSLTRVQSQGPSDPQIHLRPPNHIIWASSSQVGAPPPLLSSCQSQQVVFSGRGKPQKIPAFKEEESKASFWRSKYFGEE